jgi:peptidoglycan/LPS O-acetylase OafA/YrhL
MFGAFRYYLALLVVVAHLGPPVAPWAGAYAVFGFYTLSGYLMTLVLRQRYRPLRFGKARFLVNRALRIYPPYWLVGTLGLAIVLALPKDAAALHPVFRAPSSLAQFLANATMFGSFSCPARLVPPSWSLEIELKFYLAMAVLLARTRLTSVVWLGCSVAYTAYSLASGESVLARYTSVAGASLPFALGSVLYHVRGHLPKFSPAFSAVAVAAFATHVWIASIVWGTANVLTSGFYVSLGLATVAITALASWGDLADSHRWLQTLDQRLGDLSYPVFLTHYAAGALVSGCSHGLRTSRPVVFLCAALVVTMLLSAAIHRVVEAPVNLVRAAVRGRIREPSITRAATVAAA